MEKDLRTIADELGLSVEVLMGGSEQETVLADSPKKSKTRESKRKQPKSDVVETPVADKKKDEKVPTTKADKNAEAMRIHGIAANYQARPIEYVDGVAKEMKVSWNANKQEQFRDVGRIVLRIYKASRRGQSVVEVYEERGKNKSLIISLNNVNKGLKRAKSWASLLGLAFNPAKDIEIVPEVMGG